MGQFKWLIVQNHLFFRINYNIYNELLLIKQKWKCAQQEYPVGIIYSCHFFSILEAEALRKYLYCLSRINHCKCNWAKQQCLDVGDWVLFSFTCKCEASLWVHTVHDCQSLGQRPQNKGGGLSIMHKSCMQGVRRDYEWIIHLSMKSSGIKISSIIFFLQLIDTEHHARWA